MAQTPKPITIPEEYSYLLFRKAYGWQDEGEFMRQPTDWVALCWRTYQLECEYGPIDG